MIQLDFRTYRRRFQPPLRTRHGLWSERQGIIVRLTVRLTPSKEPAQVGYGEIAPLPWFGTETLDEAIAFCQTLTTAPLAGSDFEPASSLMAQAPGSATRFGLGAAAMQLAGNRLVTSPSLPICTLLPTGEKAIQALRDWVASTSSLPAIASTQQAARADAARTDAQIDTQTATRTFKWKIGVEHWATEQDRLRQLCQHLPAQARLRLDANGGLNQAHAESWLRLCDELQGELQIEFLEQPLPPEQFEAMQALAEQYHTPIALDESVADLDALKACHERGWRGVFVVKGAIAGHPQALLEFCAQHPLDLVFSSVFETGIARQAVWAIAQQLNPSSLPQRALGFGVEHWLEADGLATADAQMIWKQLARGMDEC